MPGMMLTDSVVQLAAVGTSTGGVALLSRLPRKPDQLVQVPQDLGAPALRRTRRKRNSNREDTGEGFPARHGQSTGS